MADQSYPRKDELMKDIREHLLVEGPRKWEPLMAKYSDICKATFYRYINQVQRTIENAADSPGALRNAQKRIRRHVDSPRRLERKIKAHLPEAPSPSIVAGNLGQAEEAFNFMRYFNQILNDAQLVRDAAVTKDENGRERLKNPVIMDKSVQRRLGILETYLHTMETVYNLEKIKELYNIVIDAVGKADPETQQMILAELRKANNSAGLTMAAHI